MKSTTVTIKGRSCRKCGADRWIPCKNKTQSFYRCLPCLNKYKYNWLKAHPERKREICWKSRGINITFLEFQQMVEHQGNACAICRKHRRLFADHDHSTGAIRELLCAGCNVLAQEPDRLREVLSYIEKHRAFVGKAA